MEMNFCRRCGTKLALRTATEYRCQNNHRIFEGALPAIGCFLVNSKDEVLLVTRASEPDKGKLDSPGGFVDPRETLEQTIARELKEELHLSPDSYGVPQYLESGINEYTFDGEVVHPLDSFFWVRVQDDLPVQAGDDAASLAWYAIDAVKPEEIGFKTVRHAFEQLKKHLT
jgi:NAD+ diphosphatase